MNPVPLRLGPLDVPGFTVQRSGLRWLCEDGHRCRPGEAVAYCNIALVPVGPGTAMGSPGARPFAAEARDFQVALAPRLAGTLRIGAGSSGGGFLDLHPDYWLWSPDFVIGTIEPGADRPPMASDGELRLLFVAGRRVAEVAEVRTGLLTGWHDRVRAWWGEGDGTPATVLGLGVCELRGILGGERSAFLELFESVAGPAHFVLTPDDALAPCARVLLEQWQRSPAQFQEIAADCARSLARHEGEPAPQDWVLAGALLSALGRTPLAESYDILTRAGLRRAGPPDAVILSVHAETPILFRHRRLGYALHCYGHRLAEAGPALRDWIADNFELVPRGLADVASDYRALIGAVRARTPMKFLILNALSSSAREEVHSYAAFDAPLSGTLGYVRHKELNLMLHDLAREGAVTVVDVDAIAAELGAAHLPDGIHQSGVLQAEVRAEILRLLRAGGVPGLAG